MATCSRSVYPPAVIKSVQRQMKKRQVGPVSIPTSLELKDCMKTANLKDVVLIEVKTDPSSKRVEEVDVLRGLEVIKRHSGKNGTLCFVVRRPEVFEGVEIFGIIKETGVDDEGLVEFADKYFDFPLYCDKTYSFYAALGDRRIGLKEILNPFSLIGIICDSIKRVTEKSVDGNFYGEGTVQGGYVIFDKNGKAQCMYQEQTGVDLRVTELVAALDVVRGNVATIG